MYYVIRYGKTDGKGEYLAVATNPLYDRNEWVDKQSVATRFAKRPHVTGNSRVVKVICKRPFRVGDKVCFPQHTVMTVVGIDDSGYLEVRHADGFTTWYQPSTIAHVV